MTIPIPTAAAIPDAVDALLKWKTSSKNPQLLPQDDFIYLVLTLKKIPQTARTNPNKIPLPNPLISPNSFSEICLIIDDRPNSKLTSSIAKEKIKTDEITAVTKVIKLSKLKTDYKPFESKRKLCDSYELFFADKRVIPLLPKLLGKTFFHKKKLPLPIDLTHNNWKDQIQRGCSSGLLFFTTGTCCVLRVAKLSMERDEILDNVTAAVNGALAFVPKKLAGVRSLHLKFSDSVALPLYQSLPDVKLRIQGKKDEVVDEVMEIVEVGKKTKSKKRIHEVENEDSISVEEDVVKSSKKKRKAGEVEVGKKKVSKKGKINDDEDENDVLGSVELDDVKPKTKKDKVAKKKTSKKSMIAEVNNDIDEEKEEIEPVSVTVKEKKRKGNAVEKNDAKLKSRDKKAKKKEQIGGDSGKKEKKKGRSGSRI